MAPNATIISRSAPSFPVAPAQASTWNPWEGRERLGCDAEIKVLVGAEVGQLLTMPMPKGGVTAMCRASVGSEYIRKSLRAASSSKFALVAVDRRLGAAVGFALCSTYNSFAGGRTASPVPATQRIVMLDLICTATSCRGLGKAMVRALIDVSKHQLGATLLMLEATNRAVGFYHNFGFRRVPDACAWPSNARLQQAHKAFQRSTWDAALTRPDVVTVASLRGKKRGKTRVTYPSFKDAAAYDKGLGGVWWAHYNRRDNGTVIMSLCLGRPGPGPYPVAWSDLTAAQLMAQNKATTKAPFTSTSDRRINADVSRYGTFQPSPPRPVVKPKTKKTRTTRTTAPTRASTRATQVSRAAGQLVGGYTLRRRR